jgi:hypothetical protein
MKNGRFFNTLFSNLNIDLNSVENINNLQIKIIILKYYHY